MRVKAPLRVNNFTRGPVLLAGLPFYSWVALGLLVLLRITTYLHTGFSISGDGVSYMKTAIFIGHHRILPPLSIQPNGYSWLLSWFDVHKDPTGALHRIGRVQQLLDFSIVIALCWLARKVLGKSNLLLLTGAWALILTQPFTGIWSRTIYSEEAVTFLTFAGLLALSFFVFNRQSKAVALAGTILAGVTLGLASILRSDVLALNTVFVFCLTIYIAFFAGSWPRWKRLKIASLLLSFIAIPLLMSSYQLASSGQFGIFTNDRDHEGYFGWVRTWPATPCEYETFAFFSRRHLWTVENYPAKAFDSESEKKTFAAIMEKWKNDYYLAASPAMDAQFKQLAQEKIRRNPIRHFIVNPAIRIFQYWFNTDGSQFYTIPFLLQRPISSLVAGLILAARLLLIALFLAGLVISLKRLQHESWVFFFGLVSYAYVILRTLELGILSPFMIAGLMELRFISITMPFFLMGALLGAHSLIEKKRPSRHP